MQTLIDESTYDNNLSSSTSFLNRWLLENGISSYQRFKNNHNQLNNKENLTPCNCLSRVNVLQQIDNLRTYPVVMEGLKNNTLRLHGWWFDLATADVYYYDTDREEFLVINEEQVENILAF